MEQILTWLAPACIILGALLTASNLGPKVTGIGFIAFTAGSLGWLGIGLISGPGSLVWQNIILALLNGFGIWRWLGRERAVEKGGKTAHDRSEVSHGETLFPASMFSRAALVDGHAEELGKGVDAMIGCRSGRVEYLVVSQGGVAGVGETFRKVDWSKVRVESEQLVAADVDLERCPAIERGEWPGR